MKKIIMTVMLMGMALIPASAQDVLNEIAKSSLAIVNDSAQSIEVRKTAVFKYDAVTYLRSKLLQPADLVGDPIDLKSVNAAVKTLNEQAYAMNTYVDLYIKRLASSKKKNRSMVSSLFKQATFDHKLFNDEDTEVTLAYYNRNDYPIQFCIDCDWVKTLAFIRTIDWSGI